MSISYNPDHKTIYPSYYREHPNSEILYLLSLYNKLVGYILKKIKLIFIQIEFLELCEFTKIITSNAI